MSFLSKLAILFLPVFALAVTAQFLVTPTSTASPEILTVVIDAGHGGIDGGVTGTESGVKEADINLDAAKRLKKLFKATGVNAVMTRETSAGLYGALSSGFKVRDLNRRVEIAKEVDADVFVSVHMNKYSDSSRRGAQVFFAANDSRSKFLAECVQKALNEMPSSVRKSSALAGDYYVLNNAPCPAIICEYGFLSNHEDEKLLLDGDYLEKISYAVFSGVVDYLSTSDTALPSAKE